MHIKLSVYKHVNKLLYFTLLEVMLGNWEKTENTLGLTEPFWWFARLCLTCFQRLNSRSFCCLFLHYTDRVTMRGNACQISTRGAKAEMRAEPGQNSPCEVHGHQEGRLEERQHPPCLPCTWWKQQNLHTDFSSRFSQQNSALILQHSSCFPHFILLGKYLC